MFPQDSLKHSTVRDFLNSQLGAEGLTAEYIINFLHNGPPGSREKGAVDFDWRNIFIAADQVLRLVSQYLEVRASLSLLGILLENILKQDKEYLWSVAADETVTITRHLHMFHISLNIEDMF